MAKLYSVTVRMSLLGQQCINRWDYVVPGTPTGASALELLTLMGLIPTGSPAIFPAGTVYGDIQGNLSHQLSFLEAQSEELYDPLDFYVAAYSPAALGLEAADVSSITDAFGFFSNRVRTDIKRGFKRFPGVPGDAYAGSSQVDAGYLAALNVIADDMSLTLVGSTANYHPAVFQFEAYTTPSGRTAYKKYASAVVQATHVAQDIQFAPYGTIRTQVSRQIGRGS